MKLLIALLAACSDDVALVEIELLIWLARFALNGALFCGVFINCIPPEVVVMVAPVPAFIIVPTPLLRLGLLFS